MVVKYISKANSALAEYEILAKGKEPDEIVRTAYMISDAIYELIKMLEELIYQRIDYKFFTLGINNWSRAEREAENIIRKLKIRESVKAKMEGQV
jgi:hypothetical protein